MKKILYVILHTCTRPDRHDGIVNSWGKDVDYIFYADCDNEEKKIIKVSDDSSYSSNEPKHINVIKYLIENDYQYDWFFFCDDDTFVNTKRLENNLENFDVEKINGYVLKGTWSGDRDLSYCFKDLNIEYNHSEDFRSQNPDYYKVDKTLIKDIFTFHYISSELMVEMYEII